MEGPRESGWGKKPEIKVTIGEKREMIVGKKKN
jgi:hypothetical protein